MKKRTIAIVMAVVMLFGITAGATLAWLTDTTETVTNTFTVGDINITLTETGATAENQYTNTFKIVPGVDITKDPLVTVVKGSEACWLFVKVDEENWPTYTDDSGKRKVEYAMAAGWTKLTGETEVYYREVASLVDAVDDSEFPVLLDNKVTVSSELTKTEANGINVNPTLTITAYAIQSAGLADVDSDGSVTAVDAWAQLNP